MNNRLEKKIRFFAKNHTINVSFRQTSKNQKVFFNNEVLI